MRVCVILNIKRRRITVRKRMTESDWGCQKFKYCTKMFRIKIWH